MLSFNRIPRLVLATAALSAGIGMGAVALAPSSSSNSVPPYPWVHSGPHPHPKRPTPTPTTPPPRLAPIVVRQHTGTFLSSIDMIATCPSGTSLTGGGFHTTNSDTVVRSSQPVPEEGTPTGWLVEFFSPHEAAAWVYAVCS